MDAHADRRKTQGRSKKIYAMKANRITAAINYRLYIHIKKKKTKNFQNKYEMKNAISAILIDVIH